MIRILWLAPTFNHYKARFLNHLASESGVSLTVLAGSGRRGQGDGTVGGELQYKVIETGVTKAYFGFSSVVRHLLSNLLMSQDWILIPAERKNILLLFYASRVRHIARKKGLNIGLFSYNHPYLKSKNAKFIRLNALITKIFFQKYDKIIFYSEASYKTAISKDLLTPGKAFWANNTVDETEIINLREDRQIPLSPPRLLMLGRLLEYRWIDRLLDYYAELKKSVPTVELHVIGDGPEKFKIEKAQKSLSDIHYYGMLIDEPKIAQIINRVDFVFIPGHSGLSINHAFAYGKPYITSRDYTNHPPEYSYLKDGINSIILSGSRSQDIEKLKHYITDKEKYDNLRAGAIDAAEKLSIRNWVKQMKFAIEA